MVGDVKRRSYDGSRRQERTRQTRARAIEAARRLFLDNGYPATSMEQISLAADVPQATLYRLFASKSAVLKAVVDITAGGDDEPVALHERAEVVALRDEPDPATYLARFAHLAEVVHERIEPVRRMLHSASAVDRDAATALAAIHEQRYVGQGFVARGLVERDALRDGITAAHAHDVIYALMSPEVRNIFLEERRWTVEQYETWLANTLRDTLLQPATTHTARPRPRRPATQQPGTGRPR